MDDFTKSFNFFKAKLEAGDPFALARFGDGELNILRGVMVGNKEFQYDGDEEFSSMLMEAFTFRHPDYYVGIGCPCCIGDKDFRWMRDTSGQNADHITYNNIFVNSNYRRFLLEIDPIFMERHAIFIGPEEGQSSLEYSYEVAFSIPKNAWRFAEEYVLKLEKLIAHKPLPRIFLFSAGPLSEVLIHRAMEINPNNTYIDIGSTLDPIIFGHSTRQYHQGFGTADKVCHWG